MPLVILCGSDFAGKTTLVGELETMWLRIKQDVSGSPAYVTKVHNGPPFSRLNGESVEEYSLRLQQRLLDQADWYDPEKMQHLQIIDRAHLGSFVYGNLFRPEQSVDGWGELGHDGTVRIDNAYAVRGGVLAILLPSPATVVARAGGRGDEYLDELIEKDIESEPRGEFDTSGSHTERRIKQLVQISSMYDVFTRQHAPTLKTFQNIGYAYYVTPERQTEEMWPDASSQTDVRRVAADILGRAIDAQIAVIRHTVNSYPAKYQTDLEPRQEPETV